MKVCPQCNAQYADDTLSFCLQDGTLLTGGPQADTPTVILGETETFVARSSYPSHTPPASEVTRVQAFEQPRTGSNTALAVALTAGGMLLLFGVIGIGAWLYMRDPGPVVANTGANTLTPPTTLNSNLSPGTPAANTNVQPSPASTVSMAPANTNTLTQPVDASAIRAEVTKEIYGSKAARDSRDLSGYMSYYADTLDQFYTKRGVSRAFVRADKARHFADYTSMQSNYSNMDITVSPDGQTATAVFDKEWNFSGAKTSSGKVRSQLVFKRINGRWLITTERDVRVYYTR